MYIYIKYINVYILESQSRRDTYRMPVHMPAKNVDDVFVYLLKNYQFSEVEKCSCAANRLRCLIPNLLTSYTHDVK